MNKVKRKYVWNCSQKDGDVTTTSYGDSLTSAFNKLSDMQQKKATTGLKFVVVNGYRM